MALRGWRWTEGGEVWLRERGCGGGDRTGDVGEAVRDMQPPSKVQLCACAGGQLAPAHTIC